MTVKRPAIQYYGGKWRVAPKIIKWFPPHTVYVEPFGGAASVLLRKEPSFIEVYNDIDSRMATLFRVLRDHAGELMYRLWLTPWSREEFACCLEYNGDDPIEIARSVIVHSQQGFGGLTGGWRTSQGVKPVVRYDWCNHFLALPAIVDRIRQVIIEHQDYQKVISRFDTPETLFYIDPPYLVEGGLYRYSMSKDQHIELANILNAIKGFVIVSATDSKLYRYLYSDWIWEPLAIFTIMKKHKTEYLIMNYEWEDDDGPK